MNDVNDVAMDEAAAADSEGAAAAAAAPAAAPAVSPVDFSAIDASMPDAPPPEGGGACTPRGQVGGGSSPGLSGGGVSPGSGSKPKWKGPEGLAQLCGTFGCQKFDGHAGLCEIVLVHSRSERKRGRSDSWRTAPEELAMAERKAKLAKLRRELISPKGGGGGGAGEG